MANLESIKILLSSRPFHACFLAFSKFPKLILQDVIYDDMKHYVEAKLGQNSLMQRLNQVQCDAISQLAENLVYKVQGDFLWVCLVGMGRFLFCHPQGQASVTVLRS